MELGDFKIRGQLTRFAAETQPAYARSIKGAISAGMAPPFAWHAQPGANAASTAVVGSVKGKLDQYTLTAPDDAAAHLSDLLELFGWPSAPLRLPQSSHAFAKNTVGPRCHSASHEGCQGKVEGSEFSFPEKDDDYYDLCFRHTDPLDGDDFSGTARRVFGPSWNTRPSPQK